jgi:hypothetical protein
MTIVLILAILIGLYNSFSSIQTTRLGLTSGVKPSDNLVSFIFLENLNNE